MSRFTELASTAAARRRGFRWDKPNRIFELECPGQCGGLAKIALIGGEVVTYCPQRCAQDAILAPLGNREVDRSDNAKSASPGAASDGARHVVRDLTSWKLEMLYAAKAALANPGAKKWAPGTDRNRVLESLIGDLKFALGNGQARYQPPGNLSATEIADELDSIARGAMDEFLPPIVASAADLDAALPAVGEPVAIVINAALIKPEAVAWLWAGRIALGKLSLIVGDPGQGKSFITLDLAARLSSGRPWPDGAAGTESGDIIILSAEDSPADTIVPRLIASGADLSRVNILTAIKHGPTERQFSLQSDLPALEAAIKRTRVQLVIIDPLTAYLGGADSHKNSNMRAVLAPLSALAERYRLAVVAVSHLNKSETSALYRVTGSLAFVAAARAVYVVAPDRENPDRKIFARLKNNLAAVDQTSLAFSIAGNPPAVTWEPTGFAINLAELLAPDLLPPRRRGPDPEKRDTAEALIRQILCDGEKHPSAKVIDAARAAGIKYPTLDKAARGLGVERRKDGFDGGWTWRLCSELNPESSAQPLLSPINLGPSVTPLQEKGLDVDYDSESSEDSKNAGRRERHEL